MNCSKIAIVIGLAFYGVLHLGLAKAQMTNAGPPQIVMTPAELAKAHLEGWPDGNIYAFTLNGTTALFSSNTNSGSTQAVSTTDLNSFPANHRLLKIKALRKGGKGAFDHKYAGGGAVYYDAPSGTLIQLYHGEFWYGGGKVEWLPAYTSLGIAVSKDLGRSWKKLGQVLSGAAPRANRCPYDIGNGTLVYRPDGYLYAYYTELEAPCQNPAIGLARAKLSDIVTAAQTGAFPGGSGSVFQKYFKGSFSQPGVRDPSKPELGGGSFTPMFSEGNIVPAMATVAYDSAIQQYVVAYVELSQDKKAALRFSPNGIHWSDAIVLNLGNAPFYLSLLNTDGGDPNVLGAHFYIYYVNPFPGISTENLMRVLINVHAEAAPQQPKP